MQHLWWDRARRRLAGLGQRLSQLHDAIDELQYGGPSFGAQERPCDSGGHGQENQGEQRDDQDRGDGDPLPATCDTGLAGRLLRVLAGRQGGTAAAGLVVTPVSSSGSGPGGGVVEVEAASGVEGVLAGAEGRAGGEDRFVIVVLAGAVDGELPLAGGADVAQPATRRRRRPDGRIASMG